MATRVLMIAAAVIALGGAGYLLGAQMGDAPREVTTTSDVAYDHYVDGRDHLVRFALDEAVQSFEAATAADSNFAMAYLQLARSQARVGHTVMARVNIKRAFDQRHHASEVERLWIELAEAQAGKKTEVADATLAELEAKYADHPWVLRHRAEMETEQARHESAIELFERALDADPESVDLHNRIGYTLLAMGEYERAVQSLQRYAFYAPDHANPHDSLGEAFYYTGRFDEAMKEFTTALELDPGFVWSAVHLAEVLSVTGQIERAQFVLDEYEPLMMQRGWMDWLSRMRLLVDLRAERWDELIERANTIVRDAEIMTEPSELTVFAYFMRTMAYLEREDLDAARASLEELSGVADTFFAAMGERFEWFEPVAAMNRAVVIARLARAEGRPEEGIEELAAAIDAAPSSPHELAYFRYHLAMAQLDAKRYEDAVATSEAALEHIPTLPSLNYTAAMAKLKLGDRDESLEHLRIYLEVMRNADEGLPNVVRAERLLQRVVPRS